MSLKFYLLICSLACLNGRGSSSSLALQNCTGYPGQYYVTDTKEPYAFALSECLILKMVPITENDLNDDELKKVIYSTYYGAGNFSPEEFWLSNPDFTDDRTFLVVSFLTEHMPWGPLHKGKTVSKCYKFSFTTPGFATLGAQCKEKHRIVCKRNLPVFRSLIGNLKTKLKSAVSKTKRLGRWIKDKFKRVGAFTGEELSQAVAAVKETFKNSKARIGTKAKDLGHWTKQHAKALAHKIGHTLKWSKDKAKGLLRKVVDVIDKETDELLKESDETEEPDEEDEETE